MNELSFRRALCGVLGITALVSLPGAFAAAAPTPEALAAQVAELSARIKELESTLASLKAATPAPVATSATPQNVDARVRVIERRLEVNAEEAAATRAKVPAVSVGEKGLAVTSPDGNYELKLRGYIQTDARFFLDDESQSNADSFLIRRVRPIFEGTVAKQFYYRVMPDFAGASVTLQDAYAEWEVLEHHKEIAKQHGGQNFILRICDVTGVDLEHQAPHSIQQFNCEESDTNRTVTVPDNGEYVAEIGYLAKNGRWLRIARSAPVHIPAVNIPSETPYS